MGKRLSVLIAAVPDPNDPQVVCWGDAGRCPTFGFLTEGQGPFVAPGPESVLHSDSLEELANALNALVRRHEDLREDKTQKIGFLETDMGILLLWKKELPESGGGPQLREQDQPGPDYEDIGDKSDQELAGVFDLQWARRTEA